MAVDAPDIVEIAKDLWERDSGAWAEVYQKAKDDLYFMGDEPYAMWNDDLRKERWLSGRPVLTIDQLSQFIHQVVNDIRQNTPSIDIIPADDASIEDARARKEIIRGIEYKSNADEVYDTAANNSVRSSIGFIRVDNEYSNNTGFEQELVIKRVINPLACMIDSDSVECDGRDAKHAFVLEDMTVDAFKKRWPQFTPSSFTAKREKKNYKSTEVVTICEFFQIEQQPVELADGQLKRTASKPIVKRYWLSGQDILEQSIFPGIYVPLIPVYGEEAWIDGKRHILSLIRKSKDVQQMYNLWASLETELLMKQPIAPVIAAAGSIEAYKDDWTKPGKSMALRYDPLDANGDPVPKPERLAPPTIPTGIVNAKVETLNDIKASLGMYNANIGQKSNAISGVAINAQKLEGDVATYHFGDNLTRSVTQVGRVLNSALSDTIDTPRLIRAVDVEGNPKMLGVNGMIGEGQQGTINLAKGSFDVRVTTGPSYTTKRQETVAAMNELFKAQPELITVMGDLYFKNSDFAGAEAMYERIRKTMDPKLVTDEKNPETQMMAAKLQEAAGAIQQLQQQVVESQQQLKAKNYTQEAQQAQSDLKYEEEILNLKKQLAIKDVQAQMMPQEPQPSAPQASSPQMIMMPPQQEHLPDMQDEGVLMALLEAAVNKRTAQEQMEAQQQQKEAEQMQMAQEQATREQSMLQLMQAIGMQMQQMGNQIEQLSSAIASPKQVLYAPDGRIIGVQ